MSDDDDMPRARPQFVNLSEAEVWKAIAQDAGGSVEAEVTRLLAELTKRLMACAGDGTGPGGDAGERKIRSAEQAYAPREISGPGAFVTLG